MRAVAIQLYPLLRAPVLYCCTGAVLSSVLVACSGSLIVAATHPQIQGPGVRSQQHMELPCILWRAWLYKLGSAIVREVNMPVVCLPWHSGSLSCGQVSLVRGPRYNGRAVCALPADATKLPCGQDLKRQLELALPGTVLCWQEGFV